MGGRVPGKVSWWRKEGMQLRDEQELASSEVGAALRVGEEPSSDYQGSAAGGDPGRLPTRARVQQSGGEKSVGTRGQGSAPLSVTHTVAWASHSPPLDPISQYKEKRWNRVNPKGLSENVF